MVVKEQSFFAISQALLSDPPETKKTVLVRQFSVCDNISRN
jgi:hypothetical protein